MKRLIICRCEEITKEEIVKAIREGARSINAIKRRTESGMGLCQGRSCERLIARILNEETGLPIEKILPMTRRPPVRPLTLELLGGKIE